MPWNQTLSRIIILKLSSQQLRKIVGEGGEETLADDHSAARAMQHNAGATEGADRPTNRSYGLRSRRHQEPQSSSASPSPTPTIQNRAHRTAHTDSQNQASQKFDETRHLGNQSPKPCSNLKIRLTFPDRPSVLRARAKKVSFNDIPHIKHITPSGSSSSDRSAISSEQRNDSSSSNQSELRYPSVSHSSEQIKPGGQVQTRSSPSSVHQPREDHHYETPVSVDFSPSTEISLGAYNYLDSDRREAKELEDIVTMAENGKPKLKLSLSQANKNDTASTEATAPNSASTPGGPLKLKLNLNKGMTASSGTTTPPAKPKKKTPKAANGTTPGSSTKKRKISLVTGAGKVSPDGHSRQQQPIKKVRILQKPHTPHTPITPAAQLLKIKHKGKVPKRPLGSGYDSELDEREEDPTILEGLIFRMVPGEHTNLIRKAIEDSKIGVPRAEGGLDIRFTALNTNGRRGLVEVKGTKYAFAVVDLPCIIEGMKSFDKKGWIKSVDISQMMLVLGPCESVEKAQDYPLPPEVDKEFKYAHGVTPPMKNVRKRRFNRTKRTSLSAIEAVERRVNQLLEADEAALESTYEYIDYDRLTQERSRAHSATLSDEEEEEEDEDADAEGDEDIEGYVNGQEAVAAETPAAAEEEDEDEDIDMDLIEGLLQDDDAAPATSGAQAPAANDSSLLVESASASPVPGLSPAQTPHNQTEDDASGDDSESDEDGSDDGEHAAEAAENEERREKLEEIEKSLAKVEDEFRRATNPFLKNKMEPRIKSLRETRAQLRGELGMDE